ncbi:unnamed protein product [Darwinula stevensoni]|uniref:LRAT domain-containing protein n=1 Tax=Darwinula stevensoni TaxID=69355 RepID=A0A7R9AEA9_9CRUS|nr:unnamed protein product [Darwinula stevensoni]CAG0902186.1 unnamed protein product [Darwinula stevensoni]
MRRMAERKEIESSKFGSDEHDKFVKTLEIGDIVVAPFGPGVSPKEEIVERAVRMVIDPIYREKNGKEYNLLTYNCEHFSSWCRYGKSASKQVETAKKVGEVTLAGTALGASMLISKKKKRSATEAGIRQIDEQQKQEDERGEYKKQK